MVCGFSGHRPHRLPWGIEESDPRCVALKIKMRQELEALIAQGADTFLCGMARGCDFYFAETVLSLQADFPGIRLVAVLPCSSQADRWPPDEQARYRRLCGACAETVRLQEAYTPDCMLRRNRWMVEHSDCLLTVYDGGAGGTAWTVQEAKRRNTPVIPIWL
jgi:uncharacterized phage-like protein YoqJ